MAESKPNIVDVDAVAGQPVELQSPDGRPGVWVIPNREPQTGTSARFQYDSPLDTRREVVFHPEPITPPSTTFRVLVKPKPAAVVVADVMIRRDGAIPSVIPGGTPEKPKLVAIERGGTYPGPLHLRDSHVRYFAFGDGDAPVVTSVGDGIKVYDGLSNVSVVGFDFRSVGGMGDGINGKEVERVSALRVDDCWFRGFRDGVSIHPKGELRDLNADYWRNLVLTGNRFLDMQGTGAKEGHGGFISGVDGLTLLENFVDGAGRNKSSIDQFAHGWYIQAGCRRVVARRNLGGFCESFFIQCRGPMVDSRGTKPTDPGPLIEDNVSVDAAIGFLANGPLVTVKGNVTAAPHFHTKVNDTKDGKRPLVHGQGCFMVHAGAGEASGNVRILFGGPKPKSVTVDGKSYAQYRMPAFDVNNRKRDASDKWAWDQGTGAVVKFNNVDDARPIDLSDLIARARAGEAIGKLVDEAKARTQSR